MSLLFERLEDRLLLTATAMKSGTTLKILADNAEIESSDHWDEVLLSDTVMIGDNLTIKTGTGDDIITAEKDISVGNNLLIDSGDGEDFLFVTERVNIGGNAQIKTGNHSDRLDLQDTGIGRNLRLDTGSGNDVVNFGEGPIFEPPVTRTRIGGKADFKLGSGNDDIEIRMTDLLGQSIFDGGSGTDYGSDLGATFPPLPPTSLQEFRDRQHVVATLPGRDPLELQHTETLMSLEFERLEGRCLLTITVTQSGGTLTINGDNADDAIALLGTAPGDFDLGYDSDGDGDVDALFDSFSGVENIRINTRGGDDAVVIWPAEIDGDVKISTGSGDDCVFLLSCDIGGKVNIKTGSGDDLVGMEGDNMIGEKLKIKTGSGIDHVFFTETAVAGNAAVSAQGGDDVVWTEADTLTFGDRSKLSGAGGSDLLSDLDDADAILMVPNLTITSFASVLDFDEVPNEIQTELENRIDDCASRFGF